MLIYWRIWYIYIYSWYFTVNVASWELENVIPWYVIDHCDPSGIDPTKVRVLGGRPWSAFAMPSEAFGKLSQELRHRSCIDLGSNPPNPKIEYLFLDLVWQQWFLQKFEAFGCFWSNLASFTFVLFPNSQHIQHHPIFPTISAPFRSRGCHGGSQTGGVWPRRLLLVSRDVHAATRWHRGRDAGSLVQHDSTDHQFHFYGLHSL